jgi:dienelactone hydrolase
VIGREAVRCSKRVASSIKTSESTIPRITLISIGDCLALLLLTVSASALGQVVEEIVQIPVEVRDIHARTHRQAITVTVFRDAKRPKSPFLVLSHGRSGKASGRAELGRARYTDNSRYFVSKGFAVFVPTRVGYGVSEGPDVEHSGSCARRDFGSVFEAGAAQVLEVIRYAKAQGYVDAGRGLLAGQSFGGAIAVAVASKNIPGVAGAINFAGGSGGDPEGSPENPCSEPTLSRVLSNYGHTSRIPTIWLYSENDRYWGRDKPVAWFKAYRAKGGMGEFVQLPAYRNDGHGSFTGNRKAWMPAIDRFLISAGFGG